MSVLDQLNTYLTTAGFTPKEETTAARLSSADHLNALKKRLKDANAALRKVNPKQTGSKERARALVKALQSQIKSLEAKIQKRADNKAAKAKAGPSDRPKPKTTTAPGRPKERGPAPVNPAKTKPTRQTTTKKPAAKVATKKPAPKPAAKTAAPAKAAGNKRLDAMKAQYKQLADQITKLQTQRKALRAKMEAAGAKFKGRKAS